MGELLFRVALKSENRRREFMEFTVHADDDSAARVLWANAAVFGIGSTVTCGQYAEYLFDEHKTGGGRTESSCAKLVADQCFRSLPVSIKRVLAEIDVIDSQGGAHPLHLNNLLKTCHYLQFYLGQGPKGRSQSDSMTPEWKRAVVSALVTAVIYCLENGDPFTNGASVQALVREFFNRYEKVCPYSARENFATLFGKLKSNVGNLNGFPKDSGGNYTQLLLVPFLANAAAIAWGKNVAYFLMVPLFETAILGGLDYNRSLALVAKAFANKNQPETIYTRDCSMGGIVLQRIRYRGQVKVRGEFQEASWESPIWIISCRHNNFIVQPNKAMFTYLNTENSGVGLILIENTKDSTKALFKGIGFPQIHWLNIIAALQEREPDLWYKANDSVTFINNGNQSHRYRDLSALTPAKLARLCQSV